MKQICKKIPAVLFAVAMSLSLLTACGEEKAPAKAPATDEVSGEWNGDDWNEFGEQHLPGTGRGGNIGGQVYHAGYWQKRRYPRDLRGASVNDGQRVCHLVLAVRCGNARS